MKTVRVLKPFRRGEQVIAPGTVIDIPADLRPKLAGYVEVLQPPAATNPVSVTCSSCQHFSANRLNPSAGLGRCALGEPRPLPWPNASRRCNHHMEEIQ